jgi:hypothetical protein
MSEKVDRKKPPGSPTTDLERMAHETDALVASSAKLVKQVEELMEECRQLRAAQTALLEEAKKIRKP